MLQQTTIYNFYIQTFQKGEIFVDKAKSAIHWLIRLGKCSSEQFANFTAYNSELNVKYSVILIFQEENVIYRTIFRLFDK